MIHRDLIDLIKKHWPLHQLLPMPGSVYTVYVDEYSFHDYRDALQLMEWRSHWKRPVVTFPCDAANDDNGA